jgi:lysylphosphatidylglycerol synthetase-like protein (DUF2156 family)
MEKSPTGLGRIIRILDEEYTELMSVGLYKEAEKVFARLEVYRKMQQEGVSVDDR